MWKCSVEENQRWFCFNRLTCDTSYPQAPPSWLAEEICVSWMMKQKLDKDFTGTFRVGFETLVSCLLSEGLMLMPPWLALNSLLGQFSLGNEPVTHKCILVDSLQNKSFFMEK